MASKDIVKKLQDFTSLSWSERTTSSGTAGTYLKARRGEGPRIIFYKLSRYNGLEIDGHECVNELIASRLMELLGINHVPYRLIHAKIRVGGQNFDTWLNSSHNFRGRNERKLSLGTFFELHKQKDENPLSFCCRMGWASEIKQLFLVDYLVVNRDRHSSNIEVIIGNDGNARLAPIFDTGLSLVAPYANNEELVEAFDPLSHVATTNFVGSRSLEENLIWAAPIANINDLHEKDESFLMRGLNEVLPLAHRKKIWEIIWMRWCEYARIRAH